MDRLFNILSYFASLTGSPGDDPLTEEWKAKQLRAWAGLLFLFIGFGGSILLADMLDAMESTNVLRQTAEQWRPTAGYIVAGVLSLLLLFATYSWWSVLRFARKHGAE